VVGGCQVTDFHVHVQPWDMLLPRARAAMEAGRNDVDRLRAMFDSPVAFLKHLDEEGVERAVLINYVSPDLMGFTPEVNEWVIRYSEEAPDRLIPFGSVNPRFTRDGAGEARRLIDRGLRGFKVHPPHQLFAANAHRTGGPGEGIGAVYGVAEEAGVPVMIHTGTSIFPGARNVFSDPMPVDDIAVDFPGLRLVLAHAGRPLHAETAFFLARRHERVVLDLSGIPPRSLLDYLPRLPELATKALWGTDWPGPGVPGLRGNVEEFLQLGLAPEASRAILHDNATAILAGASG
jgi:predicted TIM-barrel fold metal-dependent hydrolase